MVYLIAVLVLMALASVSLKVMFIVDQEKNGGFMNMLIITFVVSLFLMPVVLLAAVWVG